MLEFEVEQEFVSSNLEIDQIVGRFVQPFDLGKAPLMRVKSSTYGQWQHISPV